MKIRYVGDRARDVVPATGAREFHVEPGDEVEVDDETAASLLDQPAKFAPVGRSARSKAGDSKADTEGNGD